MHIAGVTILVTTTLFIVAADHGKEGICKNPDPGKMAQCLGEKYNRLEITETEFKDGLFKAMRMAHKEETGNYFSIGYESGNDPGIVLAEQDIYQFKKQIKLPMCLGAYRKKDHLLTEVGGERNTLLYIIGKIPDVVEFEPNEMISLTGHGRQNILYKHKEAGEIGTALSVNCAKATSDDSIRALEKRKYTTLLVPGTHWCPESLIANHNIAVGKIVKINVDVGGAAKETYRYEWSMVRTHDKTVRIGTIPDDVESVF